MRIIVRVVTALVLLCFTTAAQEEPKPAAAAAPAANSAGESKIPPAAAKLPNPVKPSPASLAQGKKSYGFDCAVCHGKDGDGKGDLAADMNLKLADYRDPAALKDFTDGEIFYIIKNGKGQMTGEGDRAKPDEIWNMVNYVRSFAKKGAAAASKPPGS
ncbi:MAG: c-type cytochrome [Candidatus Acidiferrales bacterium]